jgi:hypothetical protein
MLTVNTCHSNHGMNSVMPLQGQFKIISNISLTSSTAPSDDVSDVLHAALTRYVPTSSIILLRGGGSLLPAYLSSYFGGPSLSTSQHGRYTTTTFVGNEVRDDRGPGITGGVARCSGFKHDFVLEGAIGIHAVAPLKALSCVWSIKCLSGVHFRNG